MRQISLIENNIDRIKSKLTQAQVAAFFGAIIFGLMAHGFVMFNRLSYHDNSASLFSLGATYELGRWGLGIIYDLQLLTTKTFSVPVFNSVLSIVLIGVSAIVLVDIFQIKSRLIGAIVGALMVVYPVVTSIFSFMFTSWPYFLGLLLSVVSARFFTRGISIKNIVIGAIILACSLGMYQAFLGVTVTIVLFRLFIDVVDARIDSVSGYARDGFGYVVGLVAGLGLWEVLAVLFRRIKGIATMEYKGMDEGYDLSLFPAKLLKALQSFFGFRVEGINALRYLRLLTVVAFVIGVVLIVTLLIRCNNKLSVKLAAIVGIILLPVAMNVIYILSTSDSFIVDSLMLYADLFVVIIPLVLIERVEIANVLTTACTYIVLASTVIMTIGYTYLDNAAYLKADLYLEEAVSYWTAVVADIKACPGFTDDMEIVFVGMDNLSDNTIAEVASNEEMDGIQLEKYYNSLDAMIRYAGTLDFLREHCGFGNELVSYDDGTYAENATVQAMPTYPNDGSIAVVDGVLVVKMGEYAD